VIGGNMQVDNNSAAVQVFNNTVTKHLQCEHNASITGSGNTAASKQDQCSAF
jgi:hypothetical protein